MKPLSVKSERGFVVLGGRARGCSRAKAALVVGVDADSSGGLNNTFCRLGRIGALMLDFLEQ